MATKKTALPATQNQPEEAEAETKTFDPRESKFMDRYIETGNAFLSAVDAKYAPSVAKSKAHQWVSLSGPKPHVAAEIQRRLATQRAQTDLTMEYVRKKWREIADVNFADILVVDESGKPVVKDGRLQIDWSKLTRSQAAAIQEIDADGRVKFMGKEGVLRDMARHLGGFQKDAPQVTVNLTLEQLILGSMEKAE